MIQIKICGLRRPQDVALVNRERPDYCGFVVNFPKSLRSVSVETLRTLRAGLSDQVKPVGVFVDQPVALVAALLEDGTLSAAQLHGTEDAAYLHALRDRTDRPIWQAFQIKTQADVNRAAESAADLVLLDAGQGSGRTFDWALLRQFPRPFALAGGLRLENLPEAMATGAALLDVSGGVETDGVKDPEKVRALIRRIRQTE